MKHAKPGGFYYYCEPEKIKEYRKVRPEHKLQWLEEINLLIHKALTRKQKLHREKFRKGLL